MELFCNLDGIRALAARDDRLFQALLATSLVCLAFVAATETRADPVHPVEASAATCSAEFDPQAPYPSLPESEDPDVSGEAGIELYLQDHRGVVALEGCHYTLERPLSVGFDGLDQIELLIELPDADDLAEVFVTETGADAELIEVRGASFRHTLTPTPSGTTLGFEVSLPGQQLPTSPVIEIERPPANPQPN